jgi:hypothetical protein
MWQALDVQRADDMIDCLIQGHLAYQRSLLCQWRGDGPSRRTIGRYMGSVPEPAVPGVGWL